MGLGGLGGLGVLGDCRAGVAQSALPAGQRCPGDRLSRDILRESLPLGLAAPALLCVGSP